jgi:hypothetical protein
MHRGSAAGVTAVIGYGLISGGVSLVRAIRDAGGDTFRNRAAIAEYDRHRLEPLRPLLPALGVVGYFEDAGDPVPYSRFTLTQYALAPLLVVPTAEPTLVVGNYSDPTRPAPPDHGRPFFLLADLGYGVKWYLRPPRPSTGD